MKEKEEKEKEIWCSFSSFIQPCFDRAPMGQQTTSQNSKSGNTLKFKSERRFRLRVLDGFLSRQKVLKVVIHQRQFWAFLVVGNARTQLLWSLKALCASNWSLVPFVVAVVVSNNKTRRNFKLPSGKRKKKKRKVEEGTLECRRWEQGSRKCPGCRWTRRQRASKLTDQWKTLGGKPPAASTQYVPSY